MLRLQNTPQKPEEVKELAQLMVRYHKDLYFIAARIQMASMYFVSRVDSLIPALKGAVALNFQNNLLVRKPSVKLPEFELDFETMDTLTKN